MPDTFLILFAAGVMLAAAFADPRAVTLNWLRLAGIVALCLCGLSAFFWLRGETGADVPPFYERIQSGLVVATPVLILAQLAFVQVAWRRTQRMFAFGAFVIGVLAGSNLLHELMLVRGTALSQPPKALSVGIQTLACAGVATVSGLALMTMFLGHAYLTASKMTIAPFRRLNLALGVTLVLRALLSVAAAPLLHLRRPVPMLVQVHGLYIVTRWLVGLAVAGLFVYMAHDCIRRRSTQSATGILYVAGILVLIGELIALYLVRETGLPW